MDGCGGGLRHWLVLWCLFQATFAADFEDGTGTCQEITPDDETNGTIPLYMGVFPKADEWILDVYFTGKGSLRLSLYPEGNVINAETMSTPDDEGNLPKVKWNSDAFLKGKWSYLVLYPEGENLVISQRRDMAATTIKRLINNDFRKIKIVTENVDVTYNCTNGSMISFAKENLQVNSDEAYVQAAGPEVYLSGGSSPITNNTWHAVDSGSYSLDGAVFFQESGSKLIDVNSSLKPELDPTSSTILTTESTLIVTTQGEISSSSTGTSLSSTPSLTGHPTSTFSPVPSFSTSQRSDTSQGSPTTQKTPASQGPLTTQGSPTSQRITTPDQNTADATLSAGPSTGAIVAITFAMVLLLVALVIAYQRGVHREAWTLWNRRQEEGRVVFLGGRRGGSHCRREEDKRH